MTAAACPKCDIPAAEGATACRACGLATSRWDTYTDDPAPEAAPIEVTAAWERLAGEWGDPEAHERFLRVVAATGSFAHAGRAYRRAARERGATDERAAAGIERVRRMAEAALLGARSGAHLPSATTHVRPGGAGERERYRNMAGLVVVGLLLVILGGLVLYLVRATRRPSPDDAARPAAPAPRGTR